MSGTLLRLLIIAGDFLPPCSGSSERIWNIARILRKLGCRVILSMHIWKPFKTTEVEIIPFPRWRFYLLSVMRWLTRIVPNARHSVLQVELFSPLRSLAIRVALYPLVKRAILVIHDLSWLREV